MSDQLVALPTEGHDAYVRPETVNAITAHGTDDAKCWVHINGGWTQVGFREKPDSFMIMINMTTTEANKRIFGEPE